MGIEAQVGGSLKLCLLAACASILHATTYYVTVAGLGGEAEYDQRFAGWAKEIDKYVQSAGPESKVHTLHGESATRERVRKTLAEIAAQAKADDALILMLIGHGSFDGIDYKLNLPGPDLPARELATLLDHIPASRQLIVNMTSASGASIEPLRKSGRAVICATRVGTQRNVTVFPRFWVEALRDPAADADKNEVVTALEAYRYADQKTVKFYESQKRLATEHAMLEDTGKGAGVRAPSAENGEGLLAARFPLLRIGAAQRMAQDPAKKKLFDRKEEIEAQIDKLKYEKAAMPTDVYKKQLAGLLLELAQIQEELEK